MFAGWQKHKMRPRTTSMPPGSEEKTTDTREARKHQRHQERFHRDPPCRRRGRFRSRTRVRKWPVVEMDAGSIDQPFNSRDERYGISKAPRAVGPANLESKPNRFMFLFHTCTDLGWLVSTPIPVDIESSGVSSIIVFYRAISLSLNSISLTFRMLRIWQNSCR